VLGRETADAEPVKAGEPVRVMATATPEQAPMAAAASGKP